jgi:phospholipid transport system substrate-binding protein
MIKKIILLFFLAISFAQAETVQPPDVFVQNVVQDIITTLNADPSLVHNHEELSSYVETKVMTNFDIAFMAKQIVGQQAFSTATESDLIHLNDELKLFYIHMFTKTLSEYKDQVVKFYPFEGNSEGSEASVNGQLFDPSDETVSFDFRLNKSQTGWKVVNISVGGIDLIRTYQSNFKGIVRDGGVAKLVYELHKKNSSLARIK